MKIAIGSDDQKTIRKKHFGESPYYIICEIVKNELAGKEVRENTSIDCHTSHHGQSGTVMNLLSDCQFFFGRSMGVKSMRNISRKGIKCLITDIETIDEAIICFLSREIGRIRCFNAQEDGLVPYP